MSASLIISVPDAQNGLKTAFGNVLDLYQNDFVERNDVSPVLERVPDAFRVFLSGTSARSMHKIFDEH